jgi:hypothetical protein
MITHSGQAIFPKGSEHYDPASVPTIADIARGLGRMVRFAGQTKDYYTVLCHTLTVGEITTPDARIYALLHDAPEAIVGDVPSTWKTNAAVVRENELMEAICVANGIAWPPPKDLWEKVKAADAAALGAEAHALGHSQAQKWWPIEKFTAQGHLALHQTLYRKEQAVLLMDPEQATAAYQEAIDKALTVAREDAMILQSTTP